MIFRQMFDSTSFTYTYLLASKSGSEALIIDPVLDNVDRYIKLVDELGLKLAKAIDTHVHADHITGLGALRDRTRCITVMGARSQADAAMRVEEGDLVEIEGLALETLYTPGHTDDSYSFRMADRVFTGDALLIRGTGRTDFQHGDSVAAYHTLFDKLLKLPDETLIYPGHDYKGDTVSTIGEEKAHNPRLQVRSAEAYAEIMEHLNLPNPKLMDEAVPANLSVGFIQQDSMVKERTLTVTEAMDRMHRPDTLLVDLREDSERAKHGVIPGSVHVPYLRLDQHIKAGGLLHAMASQTGKDILVYCAYGERSTLALKALLDAGISNAHHLAGGMDAWKNAGGTVEAADGAD